MAVETPPKTSALNTVIDMIIAPKNAFEAIRNAPTWFWALAISIVVSMICSYLITPAAMHGMTADWPNQVAKSPQLAGMTPDQQANALAMGQKFAGFIFLGFLLFVPLGNLVAASTMALFNSLGRGEGSFGKYWAAACNMGIVYWGIYSVVLAAVVLARGADSFSSATAVQQAVPSLAMLAPASNVKLTAFLYYFNPIMLWSAGLTLVAMLTVGKVPKLQAWLAAIVLFILPMLIAVPFAK